MLVRLQRYLADAGVASRRASEKIITEGRVAINGRPATELGVKVDPLHDKVTVDGAPIRAKRKLYVALHKPPGYICSRADPLKRRSVFDLLPAEWSNLHTVGRLDFQSEGLLFLTNDGEFSLRMTHPRYGVSKKYWVSVEGELTPEKLRQIVQGVTDDGEFLKASRARALHQRGDRASVEMELCGGKNREARRLLESQQLIVKQLKRIEIGPINLGELRMGKWRILTETEINTLRTLTAKEFPSIQTKHNAPPAPPAPRSRTAPPRGRNRQWRPPARKPRDRP